ncbi:Hypothetical predicted protein [Lecanosticta acicola]|uniref:Heterokaryon incompatibility domain-containing protein n=1 Tax=Lecanosticta acicola TaxID=111012 RepID=A0AAI8Z0N2_9PEZI|nr:Hypothetical predicted protein [Lecanosticta acicola]
MDPSMLRLVPHFGLRKVPRYWIEEKFVLRAYTLGRDPAIERHNELIDPIEIHAVVTSFDDATRILFPSSTGSDASIKSIQTALASHEHVDSSQDDVSSDLIERPFALQEMRHRYTPARVLFLESATKVRLVEHTLGFYGRGVHLDGIECAYAALSYCWRGKESFFLRMASYSQFTSGIRTAEMPPTIRDAVQATYQLGLRMLWVDSLCIIQDSDEDKQIQIAATHDIYSGAKFVIAAAAAVDSSNNFLIDQKAHAKSPCFINICGKLDTTCERLPASGAAIFAMPTRTQELLSGDDVHLSRLRSRGWVFQEEQLAKRIIYFCDNGVILRCNYCRKSEVQPLYPTGSRQDVPHPFWPDLSFSWAKFRAAGDPTTPLAFYTHDSDETFSETYSNLQRELWWQAVTEYTQRYLSQPTDKLPALSGLATRFERKIHSLQMAHGDYDRNPVRYWCGIWVGEFLATGLLWYVRDATTLRPVPRAPSLSWAAVDGIVVNASLEGNTNSKACGIRVLQWPTDHLQQLVVRGIMKAATWHRLPEDQKLYYLGRNRSQAPEIRRHHDLARYVPLTEDSTQGPEINLLRDENAHDIGSVIWDSLDGHPDEGCQILCLRIVVEPATRADKEDFSAPWATRGLALVPVDTARNVYRRAGYIELKKTLGGLAFPSSLRPASRRAFRYPEPNIDVAGFFRNCEPTTIILV